MQAFVKCMAATLFLFLLTSSVAQERAAKNRYCHLPCQKRTYAATGEGDGSFEAPGSERLPVSERLPGGGLSIWPYIGSDGSRISVSKITFESPEIARKNFEAVVASSTYVLQRGPAIGKEGSATNGDRVLLDFSKDKQPSFAVMWRNKEYLFIFSSTSLQQIEDFEEKTEFGCN